MRGWEKVDAINSRSDNTTNYPRVKKASSSGDGSAVIHSVNSIEEIKSLELKGEHVSISDEQLVKAIEKAVKAVRGPYTTLEFNVHDKTKQIMVKVLDKETGTVIREIPPEKSLDFIAKIWEMAGILIDEKR